MAIYLDEQTRPSLTRIVKKWVEEHPKDFVADRIKKYLDSDASRLEEISRCQHTTARYVGFRKCCGKCGSFYEKGMGESWFESEFNQFGNADDPASTQEGMNGGEAVRLPKTD